jgi:hypothetical protein
MSQDDIITRDNINRELVAISVELDRILARVLAIGQGPPLGRGADNFLWDAHDRLLDARTNIEMTLGMNR